jgi:hypothetical protein
MKIGIFRRPSAVKKVFSALGAAVIVCLFFGCSVRESASEVPAAAPTAQPFETARKWAHFDIMHFEYRPEIILKAKCQKQPEKEQPWYYGFPDTEDVKKYIRAIDGALG